MTRKITARLLESYGACAKQVQLFREIFPRGIVPTLELAEHYASTFAWGWAVEHLLPAPARAEYERVTARTFVELWIASEYA